MDIKPMADTRQRTTWGTRFRFLVRAVGLTGVLAAAVGARCSSPRCIRSADQWTARTLRAAAATASTATSPRSPRSTLTVGLVAVALALVVELLSGLFLVTGRRTAASTTATVGTVAAVALLVFVNAYSFTHHSRFDFTRDQQFTLPPELADELRKLRPDEPDHHRRPAEAPHLRHALGRSRQLHQGRRGEGRPRR